MADKAKIGVMVANLLVIAVLIFVLVNLVTIRLVFPENGIRMTERRPELVWGGMQGNFILLFDENPDFESPAKEEISGNSFRPEEDLEFGTYYWKVESSGLSSDVRKFTIDSSVVIGRDESEVTNEGNTEILLHSITGAMVLDVGSSVEVGEEDVKAEQS